MTKGFASGQKNLTDLSLNSNTSAVFYKLHTYTDKDSNAMQLKDYFGNGGDFTSNGSGTPFSDTEWYAPDNTVTADNYLSMADDDYIQSILNFTDMWDATNSAGEEIVISFTHNFDGSADGVEDWFYFGNNTASVGAFVVSMNASQQIQLKFRGVTGSSSEVNSAFSGFNFNTFGSSDITHVTLWIKGTAANTVEAHMYVNGALEVSLTGGSAIDTRGNGTTPPGAVATMPIQFGARNNNGTDDRHINTASSATATKIQNWFMARRGSTSTAAKILAIAADRARYPGVAVTPEMENW